MDDQERERERRESLIDQIARRVDQHYVITNDLCVDWDLMDEDVLRALADEKVNWATWEPVGSCDGDDEHGETEGILAFGLTLEPEEDGECWADQMEGTDWRVDNAWATEFVEIVIGLEKVSSETGVICWRRGGEKAGTIRASLGGQVKIM